MSNENEILKGRSEILFIYQVKDANPNGDPLEENAPRTDPETGVATVTDVRIKRWIRDYWLERGEQLAKQYKIDKDMLNIFIVEEQKEDTSLKQAFERFQKLLSDKKLQFKTKEDVEKVIDIVSKFWIDVRTFGCVMPTGIKLVKSSSKKKNQSEEDDDDKNNEGKGNTITLTGPVQFSGFNRSFHRVEPVVIQGTAGFASKENKDQRSFREDKLLHYVCIGAYGIINEIAAVHSGMTETDRELVLEGLWNGLLDLISRSKFGHLPLLLIHIKYKEGYRIGDLTSLVKFQATVSDEKIRSTNDFTICLKGLADKIKAVEEKIDKIEYIFDDRLVFDGIKPNELYKAEHKSFSNK